MMEKQTKGRGSEVLQRQITLNKGVVRLFWAYGREYSWQLDISLNVKSWEISQPSLCSVIM